ncbi:MAG: type 1 glutamine amidotransferase [Candidatus Methylomirabilis sp.]|nr:type 1 glutamine amidotransferase [Deltaproteobacteria bacterium]
MANVIMLIENGFEDVEALYPFYRVQEAGHKVTVVGPKPGIYKSKHGYPIEAAKGAGEVRAADFKGLIIPGGQAPDRMRIHENMVMLAREAVEKGLVVGAICHGAQLLIEADVLRGKRATCYISVKTDVINAGAVYMDAPVVVDGRLVTSRNPGDLPVFGRTLTEMLG